MIHAINKSNKGQGKLKYYEIQRLSEEEASGILEGGTKVIVAFHDDAYTLFWLDDELEFTGIYHEDVHRLMFSARMGRPLNDSLDNMTVELIDDLKISEYHQRFNPGGWSRFFTAPDDIELRGFRVYDLEEGPKVLMSSLSLV